MVLFVSTTDEWYTDIAFFLTYGECPPHLNQKEKRTVKLRFVKYLLWNNTIYKK
ncbi:hypothetical protein KI387_013515, partial [Taxus chinensis]